MTEPLTPDERAAFADLPSPDEYAANGYALKPKSRYDRELATWRNRGHTAARAAMAVTDTADVRVRRLLVGSRWLDGPFRPVYFSPTAGRLLGWISDRGVYVEAGNVQARDLGGQHADDWAAYLKAEPAEDCGGSLSLALVPDPEGKRDDDGYLLEVPAVVGTTSWCSECKSFVPVADDGRGAPVLAEHDKRGRTVYA